MRAVDQHNTNTYLCTDHIISLAIQNMLSHDSIAKLVKVAKEYAKLFQQGNVLRKALKACQLRDLLQNDNGEKYPPHFVQSVQTR
mmetsp:Transcript_2113/g.7652  ORF Transcript_2113/g.7652 Transcript_2113/m.7652 type:complete len:85 (+) Transcript_2113:683-937(+)